MIVLKEQWDRGVKEKRKISKWCSYVHLISSKRDWLSLKHCGCNGLVAVLNIEKAVMAILAQQPVPSSPHLGWSTFVRITSQGHRRVTGKPWVLQGRTNMMFLWATNLEVLCWNRNQKPGLGDHQHFPSTSLQSSSETPMSLSQSSPCGSIMPMSKSLLLLRDCSWSQCRPFLSTLLTAKTTYGVQSPRASTKYQIYLTSDHQSVLESSNWLSEEPESASF